MSKSIKLTVILLLVASTLMAQKPVYVQAVARPGDGVYSLLRWYGIEKQRCNVDHFYKINEMKANAPLKSNRMYHLPIYAYTYNSKSIRSTIGDNNMEKAKRIQKYNEQMVLAKLRAKTYQDTKVLWVPHHELGCKSQVATPTKPKVDPKEVTVTATPGKPVTAATKPSEEPEPPTKNIDADLTKRIFPIFGKKYEKVPLVDNKLKGKVYYIVGGHGGRDPGAIGKSKTGQSLCEDEYAYDVSLRLARNLLKRGATVYVITRDPDDGIRSGNILKCDTDERCWKDDKIAANAKAKLLQRATAINKLYEKHKRAGTKSQTTIVIHVDSRSVRQRVDLFFYHFPESKSGKRLAQTLHGVMGQQYKIHRKNGNYSGTVSGRDLFMLRETKPAAVYVELGNIQNRADQARITIEGNRQALADWLMLGLLKANEKN